MDEPETKTCSNCKREIPAVNYTTHAVHCARNIAVCPVCKEPVPNADLQAHHDTMHKLLPCKKCGESVCGSDMEDHVRDSCAHTAQSCKFCELELPRRELPKHEGYCGARTEQCPDCREWVMIKYRQIHLDSNHGFLRLHDDPPPPKKEPAKQTKLPKPSSRPSSSNVPTASTSSSSSANIPLCRLAGSNFPSGSGRSSIGVKNTNIINANTPRSLQSSSGSSPEVNEEDSDDYEDENSTDVGKVLRDLRRAEEVSNRYHNDNSDTYDGELGEHSGTSQGGRRSQDNQKLPLKRTNDQPQVNKYVNASNNKIKEFFSKGQNPGAPRKRQAPAPPSSPCAAPSRRPPRALPTPPGPSRLPPSTSRPAPPPNPQRDLPYYSAMSRQQNEDRIRREQNAYNLANGLPPVLNPAEKLEKLRRMDALHNRERDNPHRSPPRNHPRNHPAQRHAPSRNVLRGIDVLVIDVPPSCVWLEPGQVPRLRRDLADVTPMSPEQFFARFNSMQLNDDNSPRPSPRRVSTRCGSPPRVSPARVSPARVSPQRVSPQRVNRPRVHAPHVNVLQMSPPHERPDRIDLIKNSLQELRRGLNEVTSPYNSLTDPTLSPTYVPPSDSESEPETELALIGRETQLVRTFCTTRPRNASRPAGQPQPVPAVEENQNEEEDGEGSNAEGDDLWEENVRVPCEFCGQPLPLANLVLHQTGCRPDLAQFNAASSPPRSPRSDRSSRSDRSERSERSDRSGRSPRPSRHFRMAHRENGPDLAAPSPVIPCEFCAAALPLYLITEHQERCGRDPNQLFLD